MMKVIEENVFQETARDDRIQARREIMDKSMGELLKGPVKRLRAGLVYAELLGGLETKRSVMKECADTAEFIRQTLAEQARAEDPID